MRGQHGGFYEAQVPLRLASSTVQNFSLPHLFLCSFIIKQAILRYRDKHNRTLCRRVAKKHNHTTVADRKNSTAPGFTSNLFAMCTFHVAACRIKIKAKVRPRGTRSGQWYPEDRVQKLRQKCRTQMLWNLPRAYCGDELSTLSVECFCSLCVCCERVVRGTWPEIGTTRSRTSRWVPGLTRCE